MMIETGCVTVNGEPESNPNCKVDIKTVRFAAPLPRSRTALSARLESPIFLTHTHTQDRIVAKMVGVETVLDWQDTLPLQGERREQSGPSTKRSQARKEQLKSYSSRIDGGFYAQKNAAAKDFKSDLKRASKKRTLRP